MKKALPVFFVVSSLSIGTAAFTAPAHKQGGYKSAEAEALIKACSGHFPAVDAYYKTHSDTTARIQAENRANDALVAKRDGYLDAKIRKAQEELQQVIDLPASLEQIKAAIPVFRLDLCIYQAAKAGVSVTPAPGPPPAPRPTPSPLLPPLPPLSKEAGDLLASCQPELSSVFDYYTNERGFSGEGAQNVIVVRVKGVENWRDRAVLRLDIAEESKNPTNDPPSIAALSQCFLNRRLAQLNGSPLVELSSGARLSDFGVATDPGSKAISAARRSRTMAADGRSAMECVSLQTVASGDSAVSGGHRVIFNGCSDKVEVHWCMVGGECENENGNMWTIGPGNSWPVSGKGEIRLGACHGANTIGKVKDTAGQKFVCSAPAR